MEKPWYLSAVDFESELSEKDRAFFYQKSQRKKYPKHGIIFSPGDEGRVIYFLLSGRVKIYNLSKGGKEIIYWFCLPKNFFGLAEACGGATRTVFAEAIEDAEALCISKENFETLLGRNPRIATEIMRILGSRIRHAHDTIKDLIGSDVHIRLAQVLVKLGQLCGQAGNGCIAIEKKFTHQELANMIGATRTTVTEVMNEFRKNKLIDFTSSKIIILDYDRLAGMVDSSD